MTVKNYDKKSNRITCLLAIKAKGKKFIPFVIFKGKSNNVLYKKLQKLELVIQNKIILVIQENSWIINNNQKKKINYNGSLH